MPAYRGSLRPCLAARAAHQSPWPLPGQAPSMDLAADSGERARPQGFSLVMGWRGLLSLTLCIILFVPIRRYTLPGHLPFHLELYRVVVAFVALGWTTSLLVDRR